MVCSGIGELFLNSLVGGWQEDNLAVGRFGHLLHSFEVSEDELVQVQFQEMTSQNLPDLHSRSTAQDIGGLSHQFGRLDFGARSNDLGFTSSLGLGSHGQTVLQVLAENHVLDQHALDLDTPVLGHILDDCADILRNFLTALDDVLKDTRAYDVAQGGLGSLDQGLPDVGDTECGLVRRSDAVVDDRSEEERHIVLGHTDLARDLC